jgi:hypothetical protein
LRAGTRTLAVQNLHVLPTFIQKCVCNVLYRSAQL